MSQTQMPKLHLLLKSVSFPSPIPPLYLSLRIVSKRDPSAAKGCCGIGSFCGARVPLLPSHLLRPKGLLGSWHYQ